MKKRAFSLIEVMISLALFSLLITSLLYWYYSLSSQKMAFQQARGQHIQERYFYQRLQHIFTKIEYPFFTSSAEESLVFLFDRGPYALPELSSVVIGKIFYDPLQKTLSLAVWPHPRWKERVPTHTTILLDRVSSWSYAFYAPPDLLKKPVSPEEVHKPKPKEGWQTEWRREYTSLPAIVRIYIEREEHPLAAQGIEYYFDLPVPIVYPPLLSS